MVRGRAHRPSGRVFGGIYLPFFCGRGPTIVFCQAHRFMKIMPETERRSPDRTGQASSWRLLFFWRGGGGGARWERKRAMDAKRGRAGEGYRLSGKVSEK